MKQSELVERVLGYAIEVHRNLGPGLLESAYETCLCYELEKAGIAFVRQLPVTIRYKGIELDCQYRVDVMVADQLVLELKSVQVLEPIYQAQLLTYMKLAGKKWGLLINFNVPRLKDGIKSMVL
jgi:GxxExxY protein